MKAQRYLKSGRGFDLASLEIFMGKKKKLVLEILNFISQDLSGIPIKSLLTGFSVCHLTLFMWTVQIFMLLGE